MAERRIKLNPVQREELVAIWHELALARRAAVTRVAALLNTEHINPDAPGRLAVEPDGALVLVLRDAVDTQG